MPPTCTPEKHNDYEMEKNSNTYLTTEGIEKLKIHATKNNEEEQQHIRHLTNLFPELKKVFFLHKQVGFGTFSTVYLASLKAADTLEKRYAVKHIIPTCHPERIKFELQCLKDIGGQDNIAGIDLCLRNGDNVIFIMPYQPHDSFNSYIGKMDAEETACYMKNLLKAISRVHKFNIVHRDIKPSNFLYDRKNRRYLLVDFGLAHAVPYKDEKVNNKRKHDVLSPNKHEESQQTKKHICIQNKTINTSGMQGASQKENDPRITKPKVRTKTLAKQCEYANDFQDLKSKSKSVSNVTLTSTKSCEKQEYLQKCYRQQCKCYGKPRTCTYCVTRKNLKAFRAGTPGFRPPEVLLKSTDQGVAIDIWAAGIIMLSILSNCCNFFSSPDDLTALSEIIMIFGFEKVRKVAHHYGYYLICNEKQRPLDLRKICCLLRARGKVLINSKSQCINCTQPEHLCVCIGKPLHSAIPVEFPESAYDLLQRLLDINPQTRISAESALQHPFLKDM